MIADDVGAVSVMIAQAQVRRAQHVIAMADTVTQACFATLMLWHAYFQNREPAKQEGSPFVSEHTPEETVSIDVAFGSIRFTKEAAGTFASVSVDVTILDLSSGLETENKIQMAVKFSAAPEAETVVAIIDKARGHIIERLRSAASVVEGKSAEALLFGGEL
ncbi:hypothetical protein [Beijerinckia sp. L45]|uniref:hypothetical protein n=1 Tax=Beijerinckia sp. L45 TaxID=1641855 RepID=UPI00131BF672|nr:hypothetical protein [Beijerinckia sp. L45]